MRFDRISFTCSCNGWESRNDFMFGTFIGRFPSDDAVGMAVKELSIKTQHLLPATAAGTQ